ncbi:MAG: aminopeptidase [Candidatus Helarchaeota archaeon]
MEKLEKLLYQTDKVNIIGPNDTNISFSINGIGVYKSIGRINIPDGEVFTAPIKNSINGYIKFNVPSVFQGNEFRNVAIMIENGKIIDAKSDSNQKRLIDILNQDEGSKYIGEFAFGLNPIINNPIKEILFDEKMNTSIHFAIGNSYKEADNGNRSSIHWDLILDQSIRKGGGEIYFDNKLIRKNGKFVIKDLHCLNPENLVL